MEALQKSSRCHHSALIVRVALQSRRVDRRADSVRGGSASRRTLRPDVVVESRVAADAGRRQRALATCRTTSRRRVASSRDDVGARRGPVVWLRTAAASTRSWNRWRCRWAAGGTWWGDRHCWTTRRRPRVAGSRRHDVMRCGYRRCCSYCRIDCVLPLTPMTDSVCRRPPQATSPRCLMTSAETKNIHVKARTERRNCNELTWFSFWRTDQ